MEPVLIAIVQGNGLVCPILGHIDMDVVSFSQFGLVYRSFQPALQCAVKRLIRDTLTLSSLSPRAAIPAQVTSAVAKHLTKDKIDDMVSESHLPPNKCSGTILLTAEAGMEPRPTLDG